MIRLIEKEFVRIRSYAFPPDSPLPQLSSSLPRRLRRKMPSLEVDADDLVTLRFHLRSRIACIQTCDGVVAWEVAMPCQLQIRYLQGSPQPRLEVQPADQAARIPMWDTAAPARAGFMDTQGHLTRGEQAEHSLSQGIMAPPVLEGELDSTQVAHNGDLAHQPYHNGGSSAIPEHGHMPTNGNGVGEQTGRGFVRLELLESGSEKPHIILSSDTFSLALLGRYRLLAETLAGWAEATTSVVSS